MACSRNYYGFIWMLFSCGMVCHAFPVKRTGHHPQQIQAKIHLRDNSVTDLIAAINEDEDQNLFEGDIVLSNYTLEMIQCNGRRTKRSAERARKALWHTKVIPYEIDSTLNDIQKASINEGMRAFENVSCLRWQPRTNQRNWVRFVNRTGCWSAVGREFWREGHQEISVGNRCQGTGVIMHEMLHALGFWHEQSRPDRNQYVEIMWENIEPGKESNFDKHSHGQIDTLGAQYDYDSIMHYGKFGFTKNGKPTLVAIGNKDRGLGQRNGLSAGDILQLNVLYDCTHPRGGWSSWSSFSLCDDACYKYRQRFCTGEDQQSACPGSDQYGIETENKACSPSECYAPKDGHWGRWSSWSVCNALCGPGKHHRSRKCDDPPSRYNGTYCIGQDSQIQDCLIRSCGAGSDDCHFDDDQWCHWKTDVTGTSPFPWFRSTHGTPTSHTGPSEDHTSGTGGFLYSEASLPAKPGHTTRLVSKEFAASNSTSCKIMTFFYYMYGDGMGTLNVYIKHVTSESLKKVWEKIGSQDNAWHRGEVTIKTEERYSVVFETVRGSHYRSDIGLDDVTFSNTPCVVATTTAPTSTSPITTSTPQPADYCDFGTSYGTFCTWYNDPTNPQTRDPFHLYTWTLHRGMTSSSRTGPQTDLVKHGYYIYLEASSPFTPNMKARLMSKWYQASSTMCLEFAYHMYGASMGSLNVFIDNNTSRKKVWSTSGDHGQKWHQAKMNLSSVLPFKIVIEGTRGSSYLGDLAIDDVTVRYTKCS